MPARCAGEGVATIAGARKLCCYTVNEGYLMPTLLSASQMRRELRRDVADIMIVCFGPSSALTASAAEICASHDIAFVLVPTAVLDGAPMICARFLLPKILDDTYREIVYLDGDTQIAGSMAPLLDHPLASGQILATPDPMSVMIDSQGGGWPERRAYFTSIGIPAHRHGLYFNSGVLRFQRSDWDSVSLDCLKLCARRGDDFAFRDQDALNIVIGDNHRPMSFRWNFPPFFMNFEAHRSIMPRVYHFMSNPRPWHGAFAPWGRPWHEPYKAFLASHPEMALSMPPISRLRTLKYIAQQRYKRYVEAREWGVPRVRDRIARMEAQALV